jgi:hypothetical protein
MPLQKAANFKDCSHNRWGLPQDTADMKLGVLSAMHLIAEPSRLITSIAIKNFFVTCGFSTDHVSSNDDTAVQ